ncbi:hypothetical protein N7488_004883 [Penicillium malachiteum]|nr:hypothetical protein N7488_004883 [Penicillium malachiteum]
MARHGKSKHRPKPFRPPVAKPSPPRFTMQEEARNTEFHPRSWAHSNLRYKAVKFVSAGHLQGSNNEPGKETDKANSPTETEKEATELETKDPSEPEEDDGDDFFVLDCKGADVEPTGLPNPVVYVDTTDSESSEDEVVFTGRQNNRKPVIIETDAVELQTYLQTHLESQLQADSTHHSTAQYHTQKQSHSSSEELDTPEDSNSGIGQESNTEEVLQANVEPGVGIKVAELEEEMQSHSMEEVEVQGSIDVLSKMHLDTEADSSSSDDDDMDISLSDESEDDDDLDDMDDEGLLEELALSYRNQGPGSGAFPSATAFADALDKDPYYGLDIMDFDRPSLQKKSKNKRAPQLQDLLLSDSDLESYLEGVWQKDRTKKKARKQEREELRAQGLLGRKFGDADLAVKYDKGMNLEELISEIRTFLLSPKTSLSLPPMTKHRRKTIHEMVGKVPLKSQSRGNGPSRFPVLIKTSRTPQYTRKTISQFDNLFSSKKFNRRIFQSWGPDTHKTVKPKRGGGGVTAGVSYMDGDVVGGSAPEIGAGNKGRAMLEKMGWSSGTALGAMNNKGILQPVTHVVKNSRTGLG